jgi:hypothetical protein
VTDVLQPHCRIGLPPGFSLRVAYREWGVAHALLTLDALDVADRQPTQVETSVVYDELAPAGVVAQIVKRAVIDLLLHEVDEWMTLDGARLREPHCPTDGRGHD